MIFVLPSISLAAGGWTGHRLGLARRREWCMGLAPRTIALLAVNFVWLQKAADTGSVFDGAGKAVPGLMTLEPDLLTGAGVAAMRNGRSATAP